MKEIVTDFQITGNCKVDIDAVVKEWDNVKKLWSSSEIEKLQEIN